MLDDSLGTGAKAKESKGRVFLTGAAGRLGKLVTPLLRDAGYDVVAVDVRAEPETVRELNLLDPNAVKSAMEGCNLVVHLGNHSSQAIRPPAQLFNENVSMTMNVFDTARSMKIRRIIYASTIQVVASEYLRGYTTRPPKLAYIPLDGNLPPDPTNSYALSKQVGELTLSQWATEIDLEAVSIRYPYLADYDSPKWQMWRNRSLTDEPTPTLIAQGFSWLAYHDAASLILALLRANWKGARIYYPAAPAPRSFIPLPELLEKYYQNTPRKPGFETNIPSLVDISAITNDTGWTPRYTAF